MRQCADFLETEMDPDKTFRGTVRRKEGPALHKVSEEARTVRDLERSAHLTKTLAPFLQLARAMNHAHAALMGVFGMLAVALLVFVLRQVSSEVHWEKMQRYLRLSFWGLNLGLGGMVVLNLFPSGVLQFLDVTRHGYCHARSAAFSSQPLIVALEWARMPADVVFIFLGVVPLVIVTLLTYRHARSGKLTGTSGIDHGLAATSS
jgi:hypothetical protein